jgi:hypothetical protein
MDDIIFWILIFFVFIIIIGLYISEYSPLDLNQKEKILLERFSPNVSSSTDQAEGASGLFKWGLPDNNTYSPNKPCGHSCTQECPHECPRRCPPPLPPPPIKEICPQMPINNNEICKTCDITVNKDLNKYVLKSSIPACPDMSEFITKNMMNANPDLSDYILKSEVKPCEKMDISQYILKSEIPACPTCPICPECPICPLPQVCPPIPEPVKCKQIHEYTITDHPDMSKYISLDEVNKKYVLKEKAYNCDSSKDYLSNNCKQYSITGLAGSVGSAAIKSVQKAKTSAMKSIDIFEEESKMYKGGLLDSNVLGYYAGDSLFAGV